jgi:hypothetical protein
VPSDDTRRRSGAVFNNDKFIEVVLAFADQQGTPTTQEVARRVGVNHDLAKKVIVRLEAAGLVKGLPRVGGARGPLPYEVQRGAEWDALVTLARALQAH